MKSKNNKKLPVSAIKAQERNKTVVSCWAIMFTVLKDKLNLSNDQLQTIWNEVESLSDSISNGYVNIADLKNTLKNDYGIILE